MVKKLFVLAVSLGVKRLGRYKLLKVHFVESHLVHFFFSLPKGSGLDHWFESQALSEAVSAVNVDHLDPHNPSIHEILEASRLNKNKDILQLLGKIFWRHKTELINESMVQIDEN